MKILLVAPSWVGDMVLAQSLLKYLKHEQPHCVIDVLAPAWTAPLLQRMPEVRSAIPLPFGHGQFQLWSRRRLGKSLHQRGYRQAIVLPNSWKSALVPFFAGIPQRTGFLGECRWGLLNDIRILNKVALPQTVMRFVALGLKQDETLPAHLPLPNLIADSQHALSWLHSSHINLTDGTPCLGLCIGAEFGVAKRWPHYAELAKLALQQGWQVCLFGTQQDDTMRHQIQQATRQRCLDFVGKTDLLLALDLLSLCGVVVSNDSGLMHIAAALNKPLLAIYGSSSPQHTPPMNPQARVHYLQLSCSPCFQRTCPLGHLRCLTEITASQVWAAVVERWTSAKTELAKTELAKTEK